MIDDVVIKKAFDSTDVGEFLGYLLPKSCNGIIARIIETGAEFEVGADWASQWGRIPLTVKKGASTTEAYLKACIYRMHDCLHQLWGLPIPTANFTHDDYMMYKRVQICGEVCVLTLSEFWFAKYIYDNATTNIQNILLRRNAIPLMIGDGPLAHKDIYEIVLRMDELMHKKIRPEWVRNNDYAMALCDDYVPMIQYDRDVVDANWERMQKEQWRPDNVPNTKFRDDLTGLELTMWMMKDFFHLASTANIVDEGLAQFNRDRRAKIVFPKNWNKLKSEVTEE